MFSSVWLQPKARVFSISRLTSAGIYLERVLMVTRFFGVEVGLGLGAGLRFACSIRIFSKSSILPEGI